MVLWSIAVANTVHYYYRLYYAILLHYLLVLIVLYSCYRLVLIAVVYAGTWRRTSKRLDLEVCVCNLNLNLNLYAGTWQRTSRPSVSPWKTAMLSGTSQACVANVLLTYC